MRSFERPIAQTFCDLECNELVGAGISADMLNYCA